MRFVFVDRVLHEEAATAIDVVKNVTASEDVFDDHFPGVPILPGALLVEVFEQATQLLIARSSDYARVGRLERVAQGTFRQFVRPGDRVQARCAVRHATDAGWTVDATATVEGRRVATATLTFALEDSRASEDTREQTARLRALDAALRSAAQLDAALEGKR